MYAKSTYLLLLVPVLTLGLGGIDESYYENTTRCNSLEPFPIIFVDKKQTNLALIPSRDYKLSTENNIDYPTPYYLCDLGDNADCDSWWRIDGWTKENSINSDKPMTELITDERWHSFKYVISLEDSDGKYNYQKLINIKSQTFHIPITWNSPRGLDIFLCSGSILHESECYWVQISADFGKITLIRCPANSLPKTKRQKAMGIETLGTEYNYFQWNLNLWIGFVLHKNATHLILTRINSKTDSGLKTQAIFKFKLTSSIDVRTIFQRGPTLAKIHNYNYLKTKKAGFYMIGRPFRITDNLLCISLYVSMCKTCKMIFMVAGRVVAEVGFSEEGTWRNLKLSIAHSVNKDEQLYVKTVGNEYATAENYWAIDYVKLCEIERKVYLAGKHSCSYVQPTSGYSTIKGYLDLAETSSVSFSGVQDFEIISKNQTGVDFRCKIIDRNGISNPLDFKIMCNDSYDLSSKSSIARVFPKRCNIWTEYYCGHFDITGKKLMCQLIFNKMNYGEKLETRLNFTNSEEPSDPPSQIEYEFSTNTYKIQIGWNRPVVTRGPLLGYDIIFTEKKHSQKHLNTRIIKHSFEENENVENANYILTKDFEYKPCTVYFMQVRAVNGQGPGFACTESLSTPPLLPNDLVITEMNQWVTSIDFLIKYKENYCQSQKYFTSHLYVLLTDPNDKREKDSATNSLERKLKTSFENSTKMIASYDLTLFKNSIEFKFSVGDNNTYYFNSVRESFVLKNEPLKPNRTYKVLFVCVSKYNGKIKYFLYPFDLSEAIVKGFNWVIIICLLTAILILIVIGLAIARSWNKLKFYFRPRINRGMRRPTTIDNIYFLSDRASYNEEDPSNPFPLTSFTEARSVSRRKNGSEFESNPIKIVEFEKYIKHSITNMELAKQFNSLPKGIQKPCESGSLEVNKPKNRFNNILPYDDTRVRLQKSNMDYINANYINGYKKSKAYIATQGPKALTINDFWQMVWQENVKHIIMLVNLEENGLKKVEKYWPSYNQDFEFGKIHVFYQSEEILADYEIRVFKLVSGGNEKKVFQYHFLRWPDKGVPTHFQMLVPFTRKILEITSKNPMVVHCCSGTSATGVFILCDICLRSAAETGTVDLYKVARELREQRVNMIDNVLQYKLAHLVIMECLTGIQAVLSCTDDIEKIMAKLTGVDELRLQMRYLDETTWQNRVLVSPPTHAQPFVVFSKKNKVPDIVPDANGAIQLTKYPAVDDSSVYINAIKVDGYRCPERYIVTQQPMPNTLNDFWRMIVLNNIEVIISLNEINLKDKVEKSCAFWPTEENPQMSPVDFIIVKFSSAMDQENCVKTVVHVFIDGKEMKLMRVNILSFKEWGPNSPVPTDMHSFLRFHGYADSISRQVPQCVITCYDGNLACGLYVATSYLIEKIKVEKQFDVCEAVKIMRRNRGKFISEEVQLAFLYEIAVTYLKGFQNYANFATTTHFNFNIYDYID